MIELTEKQVQALAAQHPKPLELVNPATQEVFVLIRKEVYDLTCSIVGGRPGQVWDENDGDLIQTRRGNFPPEA